jgi:hypothetical protein
MIHLKALVLRILACMGIFSIAWLTFSCKEFCEDQNRTAVVINFYDADDKPLTVRNVSIKGIENDSALYPNREVFGDVNFSQVLLPVNPSADLMRFTIQNDTLPADTLIIHYERHIGFVSSECGCTTYAKILGESESTGHTITDWVVVNPGVTTVSYRQKVVNAENIRIYY